MALIFDTSTARKEVATGPWKLEGYDTFEGGDDAFYPLDGEYATEAEARQAARARLVELERTQPSATSGGQGQFGIQDQVFIVAPNGSKTRV
jgi:hypothetical protein